MFTPIAWNSLFNVFGAALVATAAIVILFSYGVRLLVNAENAKTNAANGDVKALRSEAANRAGAYALFALSFSAVIYGVLLIVPNLIPSIK